MPPRHKNRKGCSQCGRCLAWRINAAFERKAKAHAVELTRFRSCNRCSRKYQRSVKLNEADFEAKYGGRDHADSDPEEDDDANEDDDDDEPEAPAKKDDTDDQGGGSGQGGMGQAIPVA